MANGYKGPVKKKKKNSGRAAILDLVDKEWGKSDSTMYQRSDTGKASVKSDKVTKKAKVDEVSTSTIVKERRP